MIVVVKHDRDVTAGLKPQMLVEHRIGCHSRVQLVFGLNYVIGN